MLSLHPPGAYSASRGPTCLPTRHDSISRLQCAGAASTSGSLAPSPPNAWPRTRVRAHAEAPGPGEPGKGRLGRCYLVGAGPGPADYLTVKAAKLIEAADVIVYDDLGAQDALSYARPSAERVYVGKRGGKADSVKQPQIDQLLVEHCSQGKQVVRLKGGCPSVFSRLASEIAALGAAGIPYELVPGISSALAAPLFAGFPLTHVQLSTSFTVVSGHDVEGTDWAAFARLPTLVVLMAGRNLGAIMGKLAATGWAADTPVAVIRSAGLPEQQSWVSTLGTVERDTAEAGQLSPCIVVIGKVAATGS